VVLELLVHDEEDEHADAGRGRMEKTRTSTAGAAPSVAPTKGMRSAKPTHRASTSLNGIPATEKQA
jgi:hypothetical protein